MIVSMSPKSYSDGCLNSTSSVRTEFLVGTTLTLSIYGRVARQPTGTSNPNILQDRATGQDRRDDACSSLGYTDLNTANMRDAYDEVYVYTTGRPGFILQHVVAAFAAARVSTKAEPNARWPSGVAISEYFLIL